MLRNRTSEQLLVTFDPNNNIVKLCAQGMEMEGLGQPGQASYLFHRAWHESMNDFERFIAAHYVARHQETVSEKLRWDQMSLQCALNIKDDTIGDALPSLYLNIARCYEEMGDTSRSRVNYELALSTIQSLPADGYRRMIEASIRNGLGRVSSLTAEP